MSEDRVEVYYKFTAPGTGDYYFNITPDNSLSMYAELDNSVYYPQGSSNNWDDNNAVSFDVQLSSGQTYYLVVENSSLFDSGFVTSSIFRADVNTKEHPQSINAGVAKSSLIDYIGDADYYYFYNTGGVYDIYSTGYNNGNIDTKAELYVCYNNCTTENLVATNDDHISSTTVESFYKDDTAVTAISLSGQGNYDFGFRINLYNNKTYGNKYILKIHHYNNTMTGNYTLHLNKYVGPSYSISDLKNQGVKAVLWTSNYNPNPGDLYVNIPDMFNDNVGAWNTTDVDGNHVFESNSYVITNLIIFDPQILSDVRDNLTVIRDSLSTFDILSDITSTVTFGLSSGIYTIITSIGTKIVVKEAVCDLISTTFITTALGLTIGLRINDMINEINDIIYAINHNDKLSLRTDVLLTEVPLDGSIFYQFSGYFDRNFNNLVYTETSILSDNGPFGGNITLLTNDDDIINYADEIVGY